MTNSNNKLAGSTSPKRKYCVDMWKIQCYKKLSAKSIRPTVRYVVHVNPCLHCSWNARQWQKRSRFSRISFIYFFFSASFAWIFYDIFFNYLLLAKSILCFCSVIFFYYMMVLCVCVWQCLWCSADSGCRHWHCDQHFTQSECVSCVAGKSASNDRAALG